MTTTSTDTTTTMTDGKAASTTPDIFETRESAVRGYSRSWPATFAKAQGPRQWDEDGNEYLDFFSGAGALNYGHNNPVVMNPLIEYLQSGAVLHSLDMKTPAKREFLETFEELILAPRGLDYTVMFPDRRGRTRSRPHSSSPARSPDASTCSPSPTRSTG